MPDALKSIQIKIEKLEKKVKELRADNKNWRDKYRNENSKLERLRQSIGPENPSEIERLEVENARLQVEVNSLKRNKKADEKIQKIKQILGMRDI